MEGSEPVGSGPSRVPRLTWRPAYRELVKTGRSQRAHSQDPGIRSIDEPPAPSCRPRPQRRHRPRPGDRRRPADRGTRERQRETADRPAQGPAHGGLRRGRLDRWTATPARSGIDVLAKGGNAADAAVATAAALGVTEPYSAGIGGGGFLVYYDAKTKKVSTIDGRETAPKSFTDRRVHPTRPPARRYDFSDRRHLRPLGRHPGHPGAVGEGRQRGSGREARASCSSRPSCWPASGFVVDQTFHDQTAGNAARVRACSRRPRAVFLPGGEPPAVGSTFRNPDIARAYTRAARPRARPALYGGKLRRTRSSTRPQHPTDRRRRARVYRRSARPRPTCRPTGPSTQAPIASQYKGFDVYGMPVPSSGGDRRRRDPQPLEAYEDRTGTDARRPRRRSQYLHWFSEATRRRRSPTATATWATSRRAGRRAHSATRFAGERACRSSTRTTRRPGRSRSAARTARYSGCPAAGARQAPSPTRARRRRTSSPPTSGATCASYTLTIEQTGGSGITVPGYGFLLNNELTDFNFTPLTAGVPDPNLPGPGKRPRSSMSPTIVAQGRRALPRGRVARAARSIITSVAQTLLGFLDRDLPSSTPSRRRGCRRATG